MVDDQGADGKFVTLVPDTNPDLTTIRLWDKGEPITWVNNVPKFYEECFAFVGRFSLEKMRDIMKEEKEQGSKSFFLAGADSRYVKIDEALERLEYLISK